MANIYEQSNKSQRTDDNAKDPEGRLKPGPSPCVHVRSVSDLATEKDIVEAVVQFGAVRDVLLMPRKRQALIEFEDIDGAKNCVEYCQGNTIHVAGQPAFFNFSLSHKILRQGEEESRQPNHVLLFTVLNPQYPITVDVMHTISSPYGKVLRIVIFKKNGVQAMIELDSVDAAKRAKQALNGADIYSGCCTLKIEYAKPTKLNILRNDSESWDYTNPSLGGRDHLGGRNQPLLQEPRFRTPLPYNGPAGSFDGGHVGPPPYSSAGFYDDAYDGYGRVGSYGGNAPDRFGTRHPQGRYSSRLEESYEAGLGAQGAVCMVYGLNMEKMNCDRLFNLFCLYGNVIRIKFLKSKEGSAMVQLGDPASVERAIVNLSNAFFFGKRLQLSISKQAYLQEVSNAHTLPDGTSSYKDFMGNRNNRFANPEAAHKNRIQSPSKVLHFYNAPPNITEKEIMELFEDTADKVPVSIKQFPSKTERSSTGLVEFETKSDGIEALVLVNHTPISSSESKAPFIFKLCFSTLPHSG